MEENVKLGSYTGSLRFDPEVLAWRSDIAINDGLRVTNAESAPGEVRFAGAAARGFEDNVLYHGEFVVRAENYLENLHFEMEELTAAGSLTDLAPSLAMTPIVFLRTAQN